MKAQFLAAIKSIKVDKNGATVTLETPLADLSPSLKDLARYTGDENEKVFVGIASSQKDLEFEPAET